MRLLWVFGWIGVALWSLFCLVAYGLIDVVGRLFMNNADMYSDNPETVEWIWRLLNGLHTVSTGAVLVIWALVSLMILAVPWLLGRLAAGPAAASLRRAPPTPPFGAGEGVIDLAPDQYSVRPAGSAPLRDGPAPRIGPRP